VGTGLNLGQMAVNMKDSINKEKNMEKACIYGPIKVIIKVNGFKIR